MNSFKISTKFSLSKYPSKIFTFSKFKYLFNLKKKDKVKKWEGGGGQEINFWSLGSKDFFVLKVQ